MKTLRLHLITIACSLWAVSATAQWVSIPDTNFGTWLDTSGYGQCMQGNNTVGWQLDTTCPAVVTFAVSINCSNKDISDITGIEYFDGLHELRCGQNKITFLPPLPASLVYLSCEVNQITSLPALPSGLLELRCGRNSLTTLPALPDSLYIIYCETNHLTSLPLLPEGLHVLRCSYNQLTGLPSLPSGLNALFCNGNQLTSLPALPVGLTILVCDENQLSVLPNLPNEVKSLYCSSNPLTILPTLPDSLRWLGCNNTLLSALPELPDTLYNFHCYDNPNLNCLPKLKVIRYFDFYNTGIICLPNYPEGNLISSPPLNTIALCEGINANSCPVYWNISGYEYTDNNNNCVKDTAENFVNNVRVQLRSNGVVEKEMLAAYGQYSFITETYGTYTVTVDTTNLPFVVSCPANNLYTETITATDSLHGGRNFSLSCKPGIDLEVRSIAGGFVPANIIPVHILAGDASNFYGARCATGTSGSLTLTYTGPVQFVSPHNNSLTPTVSGNTLTWNIADWGNVNFFTDFYIKMHTDTNAQLGQQVCFTLTLNPIAGDNNPANNVLTHCFVVTASFDPNDKTAYPAGNIDTAQKELTYTIRFQNTGTAEAQHIYITDTLDSDVDASTFQLLAYSHQPMVQLKENAVRFNFPNINLPDSNTNEPLSHGYVQYKVKLKPNLPVGTVINNTAYIYFDFNAPVITNTTTNTISLSTGIVTLPTAAASFTLFPNPANNSITISIPESLVGSTATMSDVMGRVVFKSEIQNSKSEINLAGLGSGIYFVTLGNRTQKLVVNK